jgi:hypothetical protein
MCFFFGLFAIIQAGIIAYELNKGYIIGGDWKPWFRYDANPVAYKISLFIQTLVLIVIIFMAFVA